MSGGRGGMAGWGARWIEALAAAGWAVRLKRGLPYVREGQVEDLAVRPGAAAATVHEPDGRAFVPRLAVRPLSTPEWAAAAEALLRAGGLAADADAPWPPAVVGVLAEAGIAILPGPGDLAADCACGERVPCRHIAALGYALAAALDADPALLPLLRGREPAALADLLTATRARLVPATPAPAAPQARVPQPPEALAAPEPAPGPAPGFWEGDPDLDALAIPITTPSDPAALLRGLGAPSFARPAAAFLPTLTPVYTAVAAAIHRLIATDDEIE